MPPAEPQSTVRALPTGGTGLLRIQWEMWHLSWDLEDREPGLPTVGGCLSSPELPLSSVRPPVCKNGDRNGCFEAPKSY